MKRQMQFRVNHVPAAMALVFGVSVLLSSPVAAKDKGNGIEAISALARTEFPLETR